MRVRKLSENKRFKDVIYDLISPYVKEYLGVFRIGRLGVFVLYTVETPWGDRLEGEPIRWNNRRNEPVVDDFSGSVLSDGDTAIDWEYTRAGWGAYEYTHGGAKYKERCNVISKLNTPDRLNKIRSMKVGQSINFKLYE